MEPPGYLFFMLRHYIQSGCGCIDSFWGLNKCYYGEIRKLALQHGALFVVSMDGNRENEMLWRSRGSLVLLHCWQTPQVALIKPGIVVSSIYLFVCSCIFISFMGTLETPETFMTNTFFFALLPPKGFGQKYI